MDEKISVRIVNFLTLWIFWDLLQFLETLTDRGLSRVNYKVPNLFKLHEDAQRCFKDFQEVWYKLESFKMCRYDMPCKVKKNTTFGFLENVEKAKNFIEDIQIS